MESLQALQVLFNTKFPSPFFLREANMNFKRIILDYKHEKDWKILVDSWSVLNQHVALISINKNLRLR